MAAEEWSANNQPDLARAVWDRLLGCFGESLLRKFGAEPPAEWSAAVRSLNHFQLERGMRRIIFGWKGPPPNLPDFVRLCRAIQSEEFDEPQRGTALPSPEGFDKWDTTANGLLLSYIRTKLSQNSRRWGAPNSSQLDAHTRILVAYKHRWAQFMRDWGADPATGEVLMATGPERTQAWHRAMESAEAEIAQEPAA